MNMKPECNNARVWLKAVNLVFSSVKVALVRISVRWTDSMEVQWALQA